MGDEAGLVGFISDTLLDLYTGVPLLSGAAMLSRSDVSARKHLNNNSSEALPTRDPLTSDGCVAMSMVG